MNRNGALLNSLLYPHLDGSRAGPVTVAGGYSLVGEAEVKSLMDAALSNLVRIERQLTRPSCREG